MTNYHKSIRNSLNKTIDDICMSVSLTEGHLKVSFQTFHALRVHLSLNNRKIS